MLKNYFRDNDLIMCFWQAGNGIASWLVERQGQLFLYAVMNSQRGLQLIYECWAYNDDRLQVDSVRRTLKLLGFIETPVFNTFSSAKTSGVLKPLEDDLKLYEDDVERQKEEYQKFLDQQEQSKVDTAAEHDPAEQSDKITPIDSVKGKSKKQ